MDDSELFGAFLQALLEDAERLRADADLDAQWRAADPEANDTTSDPAGLAELAPAPEFASAGGGPIGASTVRDASLPPERRARQSITEIDRVLDWVIASRGTAFLGEEPALRSLLDEANRLTIRTRLLDIIDAEAALSPGLAQRVPENVTLPEVLAMLHVVLHVRELAEVLEHLDRLIDQYFAVIALDTAIASFRLVRKAAQLRLKVLDVRRGRNTLSTLLRSMCRATKHARPTHQLFVEQQLERLMTMRVGWQQRLRIAEAVGVAEPSSADLANVERQLEIARQLPSLDADIAALDAQLRSRARIDRADRRSAREELSLLRSLLRSKRLDGQDIRRERDMLRRELRGEAYNRVVAYLEALRRGVLRADAVRERDELLAQADDALRSLVPERLSSGTEQERWTRYQMLVARLLRNQRNVSLELFMDSFLKVAQYTERGREIGLETHKRGEVQWLTYPGHGDGAVDLNCAARIAVTVAVPDDLALPARFRSDSADSMNYSYVSTEATDRVHGTTDLQDIFGHIAGALIPSRGSRGATSEDLSNTLSKNDGADLAPVEVAARPLNSREVTSILIGLLAENLTAVPNASEFDALRSEIADDIEAAVVRRLGRPRGTRVFRRGVPVSGRGSLGRFIDGVTQQDLVAAVRDELRTLMTRSYSQERTGVVHRLWRLVIWMRSAGAEAHRRAGSVTIRHTYRAAGQPDLLVEVYYTHLHRVTVRPRVRLTRGRQLGLTGMTGNAVNPHVHMEIRAMRDGTVLGALLPHEFFPLRPP